MVRSDEDLLLAARDGDGDAFAAFYRRHVTAITGFHRRRVAVPELAFDLTAETFASLVAALDRFDPSRGSARGWLFTIAVNELRQALRRQQVEDSARRQLLLEPIVLDDRAIELIEARSSPGAVQQALAALPAPEREAIEARVLEGASYDEIAARLRCSTSVVRQRVSRGLRRLRDTVEERS
ncbi:MAG: polymerase sigma factor [Frankiales bacterium]|nr:polymerase sigma factor [Frankiales bacterium]